MIALILALLNAPVLFAEEIEASTITAKSKYHCDKCSIDFKDAKELKEHLQKHGVYMCAKCEAKFKDKKALKLHNKKEHMKMKACRCSGVAEAECDCGGEKKPYCDCKH